MDELKLVFPDLPYAVEEAMNRLRINVKFCGKNTKKIMLTSCLLNKKLVMEGVVFTMYDARTNLSLQVVENVKDNLQQNIYKTIIPRNVRLAEAPSYGQPITLYDPRSTGAEAYRLLAEEVINREVE